MLIQFLIHDDLFEIRHHRINWQQVHAYHDAFTELDAISGWRVAEVMSDVATSKETIEARSLELLNAMRERWTLLARGSNEYRVIYGGFCYTAYDIQMGRLKPASVTYQDGKSKKCFLSCQGRIPQWLRTRTPDNVISVVESFTDDIEATEAERSFR
jgi:hypothetical protein